MKELRIIMFTWVNFSITLNAIVAKTASERPLRLQNSSLKRKRKQHIKQVAEV